MPARHAGLACHIPIVPGAGKVTALLCLTLPFLRRWLVRPPLTSFPDGVMAVFSSSLLRLVAGRPRDSQGHQSSSSARIRYYGIILGVVWTLAIVSSMAWNNVLQKRQTHQIALNEAKTVYEKDFLYYRWATGHHGVFVPITATTRPNPYLEQQPEFEISTAAGESLTLINPEYMIRQVYEMQTKQHGPLGHITSLDPIRPENAADPWESNALTAFEDGAVEVSSVENINNEPYLRLMRPMITEKGCLKCHALQGYDIGDIRGGISVSIPLSPLLAIARENITTYSVVHGLLWIFGMVGIFFASGSTRQSIGRVERAEARTRLVIENMMDGVITLDEKGTIESLNSSASQMFGSTPGDVVGLNLDRLLESPAAHDVSPGDAQWGAKVLHMSRGSVQEVMGKRPDGTIFPLEISVSAMSLGQKRVFIVMARDNTKRKIAESALRDSQKQIIEQEKLVSLGTMVAGIAHEINNPAQAINFSMEGLKMNIGYVKELLEALEPCLDSVANGLAEECNCLKEKVAQLRLNLVLRAIDNLAERNIESIGRINDIISSTKRMAHSDEEFGSCDVNTIVNDAITLTYNQVKYDMDLETDQAADLPMIKGFPQELGQVFINMIINAKDAMQGKGLTKKEALLHISTTYNPAKVGVEVKFEDNGAGIAPEVRDKIFDPFFTTKPLGKGMGLGLNLCHRIIDAHGGEILVDSTPGQGTCFTVFLKVDGPLVNQQA